MIRDDSAGMTMALSLGRRGLGQVWPNPAVGCVIFAGGRVVGRGWTQPGGRPHAETMALAQAGPAARGATAYVTLEPCAHHGHTPPCAKALIASGIARVVSAMQDPDPRVAGQGHAMLRAAAIDVTTGVLAARAARDHAGFLCRIGQGRPLVTLKLATSFDGRIATSDGESRWITGAPARRWVHAQRLLHDAVLIGGGTARADDPALTVRGLGPVRQPVRMVASRDLDLPDGSRLAASTGEGPVWFLHGPDAPPQRHASLIAAGVRCLEVAAAPHGLDPRALLQRLGAEGITRVFCEGGGTFAAALLQAGCVDRLVGVTAGIALGAEGRPALGALDRASLADARRFALVASRVVGGDIVHEWDIL